MLSSHNIKKEESTLTFTTKPASSSNSVKVNLIIWLTGVILSRQIIIDNQIHLQVYMHKPSKKASTKKHFAEEIDRVGQKD